MNYTIILALMGGLGLFLYGMKLMSDGLEKAAGAKLRRILEIFTTNRLTGMLVGIFFTAVIQSSSAATVMVVSFVNAGLMNLSQAAGVILGANIGTTVTSQLVSFNLSEVAPVFLMAGVIMVLFMNNPTVQKVGEVVLGFGVLFMGLTSMSSAMSVLRDSPLITSYLQTLDNHFLGVLFGFIMTAILQSSSVTVSIVLLMASQGLLHLPICFFIILGCNMGSCVSALLASLSGNKGAKRAAMIHFLFNIFGSIIIFTGLSFALTPITNFFLSISGGNLGRSVANAHTTFKIIEVLFMFPCTPLVVALTEKIIRGKDEKVHHNELQYITEISLKSPATMIPQAKNELRRMANMAQENLDHAIHGFLNQSDEFVDKMLKKAFPNHKFTQAWGQKPQYKTKPEPDALLALLDMSGVTPEECFYVGDSDVDVFTANNAGVKMAGVSWGFRGKNELMNAGAPFVADTAEELFDYICKFI